MIRLAGRAPAGDLAVDLCPARPGSVQRFQEEEPRPFAQHEAVAVTRKRTRGALGSMIPALGQDAHQQEAADDEVGDRSVGASYQHALRRAEADLAEGV